jgi:hypothetical protein
MTNNVEDIKGFVRSQVDAAIHLSGPISERSFSIIIQRTIKHFDLPLTTEIELVGIFGNYEIRINFNQDAPPQPSATKPKTKRLTPANSKIESSIPIGDTSPDEPSGLFVVTFPPNDQASIVSVSPSSVLPIDGAGGT